VMVHFNQSLAVDWGIWNLVNAQSISIPPCETADHVSLPLIEDRSRDMRSY
jgi:hypothetical protein